MRNQTDLMKEVLQILTEDEDIDRLFAVFASSLDLDDHLKREIFDTCVELNSFEAGARFSAAEISSLSVFIKSAEGIRYLKERRVSLCRASN